MKDRVKDSEGNWVATDKTVERTEYTLRDEFGEKLVFLGGNDFRHLEGEEVSITLNIRYNSYERKTTVSLATMIGH